MEELSTLFFGRDHRNYQKVRNISKSFQGYNITFTAINIGLSYHFSPFSRIAFISLHISIESTNGFTICRRFDRSLNYFDLFTSKVNNAAEHQALSTNTRVKNVDN